MTHEPWVDPLGALSKAERAQIHSIVQDLLRHHRYATPQEYREVWRALARIGPVTPEKLAAIKESIVSPLLDAERYFWEDAIESRLNRVPIRSQKREELERLLLLVGLLTDADIANRNSLMSKIASHEPVQLRTMVAVIDDGAIAARIGALDEDRQHVNALFMPEGR